ncbi:branched-chain amino acid ABC transporter permease [Streptomyces asiaticus]|uniref:branched-chain amino acid ABC transporter permease n=1 Tax=Streptomyces sp. NPDC059455 TaxID=3346837 RepID=UPI00369C239C
MTAAVTGAPPSHMRTRLSVAAGVLVLVLLAALPLLGASVYMVVVMTSLMGYALLAVSINLVGDAGLLSLAHAGYAGVGSYGTVIVARELTPNAWLQLLVAIAAAAGAAALTGWIAVHASKVFFLMLSLAIGELLYILALQWRPVTRGSDGLSGGAPFELMPGVPIALPGIVYWYALAVSTVGVGAVAIIVRSPFGSALRGIRDNEPRMRSLGYVTARYKYGVWVLSGAFAGAAGWVLVAQTPRFVAPSQLGFQMAGLLLLAVVVGGLGSIWGSCLAAALIVVVSDVLGQDLGGRGPLVLGLFFVVAVYVLPRGLAGLVNRRPARSAEPLQPPEPDPGPPQEQVMHSGGRTA